MASSWKLHTQTKDFSGLVWSTEERLPSDKELKDDEVLVELKAASLNYRDFMIATGKLGLKFRPDVILGSDGAGVVVATGKNVSAFRSGDRVVTHLTPARYPTDEPGLYPLSSSTFPHLGHANAGLGQGIDGTLATHGVFDQSALAKLDEGDSITFEQAATLTCSGLTAWNALMGLEGKQPKKGDWVLVQGTGGVSIAALQLAVAAGATVVATTSSEAKAARLRELGAHHVINYREDSNWGTTARGLTPDGRGIDLILDVGGNTTLGESFKAVAVNGLVVAAGMIGGFEGAEPQTIMTVLYSVATLRGVILGTKDQLGDLIRFVREHHIVLATDDVVFPLKEAPAAYKRLEEQKHFAKVVIQIPGTS